MKLLKNLLMAVILSSLLIACGSGGGGGGGGDNSDTSPLVGTWDMTKIQGGDNPGTVQSGSVTFVFTESTFSFKHSFCDESGTYTTDGSTMRLTTAESKDLTSDNSGNCHKIGDIADLPYTVTATTFTFIEGDVTVIWNKL